LTPAPRKGPIASALQGLRASTAFKSCMSSASRAHATRAPSVASACGGIAPAPKSAHLLLAHELEGLAQQRVEGLGGAPRRAAVAADCERRDVQQALHAGRRERHRLRGAGGGACTRGTQGTDLTKRTAWNRQWRPELKLLDRCTADLRTSFKQKMPAACRVCCSRLQRHMMPCIH
jgi:hypothetical protein